MGSRSTIWTCLIALALLVSCNDPSAGSEGTTTTTTTVAMTTTLPATTTTTANRCLVVFCVRYHINADAVWSDGEPVTANDFVHTYQVMSHAPAVLVDRSGYDLVTESVVIDPKTVLFAFSEAYPAWRTLFDVVLPAHYEGDFDEPGAPVSGSFALTDWIEGEQIVLGRNPSAWTDLDPASGSPLGDVSEIVFVFPESVRDQMRALESGDVDVISPRPLDWMVEDLENMGEAVGYQLTPGPFWDHIDFNHDDPLLSQQWVRRAVALAIDREAILDATVRTVDESAAGLDNAVWLQGSPHYRDDYDHVYDPEESQRILAEHFCERGDDGIFSCEGRRLSFTWTTTVGDEYRERVFDMARDSLEEVGIEVTLELRTPSALFSSPVLFGGPDVWQIIDFSWKGEPDPHLANSTFYCEGGAPSGFGELNVNRYCSAAVEELIRSTDQIVDPGERASAYNTADAAYLDDLAMIPLYQKPTLLAWSSALSGLEPNISEASDLWNVASWTGKESVVVALDSEPETLDPVVPESDSASAILSAMFRGAFTVDSSLEYVPVLVDDAEPILGGS